MGGGERRRERGSDQPFLEAVDKRGGKREREEREGRRGRRRRVELSDLPNRTGARAVTEGVSLVVGWSSLSSWGVDC